MTDVSNDATRVRMIQKNTALSHEIQSQNTVLHDAQRDDWMRSSCSRHCHGRRTHRVGMGRFVVAVKMALYRCNDGETRNV